METNIEMYRRARERLRAARSRGEETESQERDCEALWAMMSWADRRTVLGVGDDREVKRAA